MASGVDTTPQFVLRLVEGKGLLGLKSPLPLPLGRLERLDLEIPNLRFPFDGSGEPARFRNRRCTVRDAQLRIDEEQLSAWLRGRPLRRYGIDELHARLSGDCVQLAGTLTIGERRTSFTCRARIMGVASSLRVELEDLRTYHPLPAASPLVGLALLYALGARPPSERDAAAPPGFVLRGIDVMEIDALPLALWRALLPAGWRLPRADAIEEATVTTDEHTLLFSFKELTRNTLPGSHAPRMPAEARQTLETGDGQLAAGDLKAALETYEKLGPLPLAIERRAATLLVLGRASEAEKLARDLVERDGERGSALTQLAVILVERHALDEAAELFQRAAVLSERAGEPAGAIEAALRAAELLIDVRPTAATPLLERVIAGRSTHARAAQLLADRYASEGRHADLLRLEKRRLTQARGQEEEARARVRLGAVWLDFHDDALRARDELERALRLFPGDASTFRLYARALERSGDLERAYEAAEQVLAMSDAASARYDRLAAAQHAERAGKLDEAHHHAEELLEDHATDQETLELLARLATKRGNHEGAIAAYERAAGASENDAQRSRLYFAAAQLGLSNESTRGKARLLLERAREASPTPEILRMAAQLAESEGRGEDLDELLAKLGQGGDRDARVQRVRLLLTAGRSAEAATEAEALATLGDSASLRLLVEARRAEGSRDPLATALQRLSEATRDPAPRIELGKLRAESGDLVGARILLEESLPLAEERSTEARDALELLCDVLLRQGDDASLDVALGRLAAVRDEPAAKARALGAQAGARARLGRLDAALSSYREALTADPNDLQSRLGLAETAYVLRLWDEARQSLERVYDVQPRPDRALRLGEIAERQSRPADAIHFYEAALETGASGADAQRIYGALTSLHHARGEWEPEARLLLRAAEDARTPDTDATRAGRLVQAADLLRKRVGRLEEAQPLYDRALELDAMNLPALDALESLALEREDWVRAAQILSRKVAATAKRPGEQKAILGRLAVLQAERLGREDAAREAWSRALALDPRFRPALAFLARDARQRGHRGEEIDRLERLTALGADPADPESRIGDLARLGQLYVEESRLEEAEKVARRILSEQPRHAATLAMLDDIFTRGGRHAELETLLGVRAQVETDYDAATEILLRRGALLESAGRINDAIGSYERVTALRPGHLGAWSRLADLLRQSQAWDKLADALGRLAEQHAAAGRRDEATSLFVEQAHVLHDSLADAEKARTVLERAREGAPGSRLVIGALLALARGRQDADTEATLLDRLIDLESDTQARGLAVLERARTLVQSNDSAGALRRLRELSPTTAPEAALRLRLELEQSATEPAAVAELLEALRARAEADGNIELERFALERALVLARDQPALRSEGIAQRLLELEPRHRDALRSLADVAQQRGDDATRRQLIQRLLDEARRRFEGPAAEALLLVELGQLADKRGDRDRAEAFLREAADAVPNDAAVRRALGLHLADTGHDIEATTHLGRAAELAPLPQADQLKLADLYERIGQSQRAATALLAAGELAPHGRRAAAAARLGHEAEARTSAFAALSADAKDTVALDILLAGLSPAALIAQVEELAPLIGKTRAAELIEWHAQGFTPTDARLALERAVVLEPNATRHVALARLLEGAEASAAWAAALELDATLIEAALGRAEFLLPDDAVPLLERSLAAAPRSRDRGRAALRLGELETARTRTREARRAYATALGDLDAAQDATLRIRAARALAAAARAEGDSDEAEQALRLVLTTGQSTDADVRSLAELLLDRGDHAQAARLLEQLPRPGALYTRALERGDQPKLLVDHLEREAADRVPEEARPLLLRAAQLATDALDDPARAVVLLERAVPLGPSDAELWERMGNIQRDKLHKPDVAARSFARAWGADQARVHLLLPLADYHHEAGEHAPARDYYMSLLQADAADHDARPRVHMRLAEYARARADAIEEEAQLRAAVERAPSPQALSRLVELYRVREDKLRLEQALMQLAELTPSSDRLPLLREARDLMGPAPQPELDERILALDRTDSAARERLLARLRSADDPAPLLDRFERDIESTLAEGGTVSPELAADLGHVALSRGDVERAARLFTLATRHGAGVPALRAAVDALRKLNRVAEAVPLVEKQLDSAEPAQRTELETLLLGILLDVAPDRALPLLERARARGVELPVEGPAYRRLLRGQARFDELAAALDRAAEDASGDAKLELALESAELFEGPLQRPRDAARRLAALFEAHPKRRDLAARARSLYLAGDEPIYALGIVDKELADADPDEIPSLKITRGEILLAADADAEAEAEFLHALITTKRVGRAHAALADVYRKRGDLASALEHLIAAADAPDLEPARAAACAVDAADVLLIEGDTATAERLYQLAAALDPADRRALDALIRLASAQSAFERQADLLGRAASLTADRRERARLLHERARLFESELHRDLDAYRAYREAVACDPTLREAVRSLRVLAEARGEWAVAAEQLYREAALTDDAQEKARIHSRLAQVHEERLFDSAAALRNLEQAATLHGTARLDASESPWPALVRLYSEAQRFNDASEAADKLVAALPEETAPAARGEAIARAAQLHARAGHHELAEQRRAEAATAARAFPLYDETMNDASPAEQRRAIEDRLRTEPEGDTRVALLRRLVSLLSPQDDLVALDQHAQALLAQAPDDPVAFLARRRVLEARRDTAQLVALLRSRSLVTSDPRERAERRYEAGRLAETQLYDVPGSATDYEAALDADPDHIAALDALADLSFRTRHLQRARALYDRLGDRSGLLAADEVSRRRGELAEEAGDMNAARTGYAAAAALNPGNLGAQQALARVALRLGDDRSAYTALRSVLELLPRESSDRAAELRRHLGELAARLGELADARTLLESLIVDDPNRRDVLAALSDVYERSSLWREAATLYERRLVHSDRNDERAELLFRQGEALIRAGEAESASDSFLKAADLNPRHAPTLRRLVRHYLRIGEYTSVQEVVEEIEALGAPLLESAVDAGLGIALRGDEARGAIVAALAQPTVNVIVEALGSLVWPAPSNLDAAIRTALRAAGGGPAGRDRVIAAIEETVLRGEPLPTLRLVLGSLLEQAGRPLRARQHLELLAYLRPEALLEPRIAQLQTARLPEVSAEQLVPLAARGPLRDALSDLGPLCLGLPVAPLHVDAAPQTAELLAPVAALFGYPQLEAALLDRLADPAWAEPSRPPRLLLQRRLQDDPGALRFAVARALHALHAGLGLLHGRSTEDIAAMLRAAAATFLPDLRTDGPFVRAWQAELLALGLRPERVPEELRTRLEMSLATLIVDRTVPEQAHAYAEAERLTANRVAYVVTADLRGGLVALDGGLEIGERERALHEDPALADLVRFALSLP